MIILAMLTLWLCLGSLALDASRPHVASSARADMGAGMSSKAGVIGGGVGGLVVARNLAEAGFETTLIEANAELGGRMNSFKVLHSLGEFRFDTGPSLLLLPNIYRQTLGQDSGVEMLMVDPFYRVYFEGEEARPVDLEAVEGAIEETLLRQIDPDRTLKNVDKAFRRYKRIADSFLTFGLPAVIQETFPGWKEFVNFLGAAIEAFPLFSHDTMIRDVFGLSKEEEIVDSFQWSPGKKLRALLSFQDLYVGLAPSKTPAVFSLLQALEYSQGIYYPRGGFKTIAESLENSAIKAGVHIKKETTVTSLVMSPTRNGMSRNVKSMMLSDFDGHDEIEVEVDCVVSNVDVPYAESSSLLREVRVAAAEGCDLTPVGDKLTPSPPTNCDYSEGRARKAIPSCSVISLHLGFDCDLSRVFQHHTLFLSPLIASSWSNAEEDGGKFNPEYGINFYVHAPKRTDKSACPDGCDAITILVPVRPPHPRFLPPSGVNLTPISLYIASILCIAYLSIA